MRVSGKICDKFDRDSNFRTLFSENVKIGKGRNQLGKSALDIAGDCVKI